MRIIAGTHKGRNILSPSNKGIRPTSSKMREAMFDMIMSNGYLVPSKTKVVDLCCGTGALGLEALSRGAEKVIFIDGSREHLFLAKQNVLNFKESDKAKFIVANAERLLNATEQFGLIFIDPPYMKQVVKNALNSLYEKNWLEEDAIIIIEMARAEDLKYNLNYYMEIDTKIFGNSKFIILRKI